MSRMPAPYLLLAFLVRAKAAACDALMALARRSSGVIFAALAFPPRRPNSAAASDATLAFTAFVLNAGRLLAVMLLHYLRAATVKQA